MRSKSPLHVPFKQIDVWNNFSKRLLSAPEVELFLDYDGTITPIRLTPAEAVLSPDTIQIMRELINLPKVRVTIVTGRSMKDIRSILPFENIRIVANHGFHMYLDGEEWIHPDAELSVLNMQQTKEELQHLLEPYKGIFVEDKKYTLSIHYRNALVRDIPEITKITQKTALSFNEKFIITEGKEVMEIRPPVNWGKGHAVSKILKAHKYPALSLKVYIGDDMTDEDAFQVLKSTGITIHVGKTNETMAQYYVSDVDEVLQILKMIIKLRTHTSGGRIKS